MHNVHLHQQYMCPLYLYDLIVIALSISNPNSDPTYSLTLSTSSIYLYLLVYEQSALTHPVSIHYYSYR